METWPSSFPKVQIDLQTDVSAQTTRTKQAVGLIQQRKRFSGTTNFLTVSCDMSDAIFGQFLAFRQFRLNLGSDWFLMRVPLDGDETTLRKVRLVDGKYSVAYVPVGCWKVSVKLDLQDDPVMSEADLDDILSDAAGLVDDSDEPFVTDFGDSILVRL